MQCGSSSVSARKCSSSRDLAASLTSVLDKNVLRDLGLLFAQSLVTLFPGGFPEYL